MQERSRKKRRREEGMVIEEGVEREEREGEVERRVKERG